VELADGQTLHADAVIVGIGILPNQELAQSAGLPCENGVVVDEHARTADPDIYAAGDCTWHPNAFARGMARLECVQNAIDQGRVAGGNAAGANTAYATPPWFWSDQYEVKLQGTGISTGFDRVVMRGDMKDGAFSIFYFAGRSLLAVETVNKPGEHMMARKLLAARVELDDAQVADTAYDLRQALAK
jgi:3-phenylpropionate/trans-cinnamate dioxygenase ferredoxin reductase subunit